MQYAPPIGSTDPNAPYIDANPGAGIEGSAVPAAAIEPSMREIVAVITAAGLTPSDTDLTQLLKAIKALGGTKLPAPAADNMLAGNAAGEWALRTPAEVLSLIKALPLTGGTLTGALTATGFNGPLNGNASSATILATARALNVNLASTLAVNFNGSAAASLGVTGILAIANGGTGLAAAPSLLVNLASTTAASPLLASPRPGVTGTLPVGNGGTGVISLTALIDPLFNEGSEPSVKYIPVIGSSHGNRILLPIQSVRAAMGLGDTTGAVPVANGGTGGTTAAAARTNLGVAYTQTTTANGYYQLPGGIIIQWGSGTTNNATETGTYISLPMAFPSAGRSVIASDVGSGVHTISATFNGASQIRVWARNPGGSYASGTAFTWIAIGY